MKKVIERFFNQSKYDEDYKQKFNERLYQRFGVRSLVELACSPMAQMEVLGGDFVAKRVDPVQRIADQIKEEVKTNEADYTTETEYEFLNVTVNSSNQVVFIVIENGKARPLTDDGKRELIVVEA